MYDVLYTQSLAPGGIAVGLEEEVDRWINAIIDGTEEGEDLQARFQVTPAQKQAMAWIRRHSSDRSIEDRWRYRR